MYTLGLIRRVAIALLAVAACQNALAQSGLPIRNFRVDVAPLRANAGDPTASWVQRGLPDQLAQALAGRMTAQGGTLVVRIDYCHSGANQGQLGLGQHQRRRDDWGRTVARAGDRKISGFGDRPGEVRGIQSPTCDATRASAHVLAGQRPLKIPRGRSCAPCLAGAPRITVTRHPLPILQSVCADHKPRVEGAAGGIHMVRRLSRHLLVTKNGLLGKSCKCVMAAA